MSERYFANPTTREVVVADPRHIRGRTDGPWLEVGGESGRQRVGAGCVYYADLDDFSAPQPFASWERAPDRAEWVPPADAEGRRTLLSVWVEAERRWMDEAEQIRLLDVDKLSGGLFGR